MNATTEPTTSTPTLNGVKNCPLPAAICSGLPEPRADELLHELVRAVLHRLGWCVGDDFSFIQERDVIGDVERRRDVVADHDAGDAELLFRAFDHLVDVVGGDRI